MSYKYHEVAANYAAVPAWAGKPPETTFTSTAPGCLAKEKLHLDRHLNSLEDLCGGAQTARTRLHLLCNRFGVPVPPSPVSNASAQPEAQSIVAKLEDASRYLLSQLSDIQDALTQLETV